MLRILLILIFIRPFISSAAFPCADATYSFLLIGILLLLALTKGISGGCTREIGLPLALFVTGLAISCIFSQNRTSSIEQLYKYAQGAFALLAVVSVPPKEKDTIIDALLAASVIISLVAAYQYLVGFNSLLGFMHRHGISDAFAFDYIGRRRPFLPFVTPNALGGYLGMMIPLFLAGRKKSWVVILPIIALVLTKSVAAIVSLCAGLALYTWLSGRTNKKLIALPILLAGAAVCIFMMRAVAGQAHTQPVFSALMRLSYWKDTIGLIKAHFLTGVGIGTFDLPGSRYAHNSYLQLWAETGIIGIAAFLWLVAAFFTAAFKNLRVAASKNLSAALLAASSIFLLHNLLDFTFFLPEISLLWWIITGLAYRKT